MAKRIATYIAEHLRADPIIAGIAEDRVLDMDYRSFGWESSPVPVHDADGLLLPTLVVDDGIASSPMFGPSAGEEHTYYVWGFNIRSAFGAEQVETMMRAAKIALHQWQIPETKAIIMWTGFLGSVMADDGLYNRSSFRLVTIPGGITG